WWSVASSPVRPGTCSRCTFPAPVRTHSLRRAAPGWNRWNADRRSPKHDERARSAAQRGGLACRMGCRHRAECGAPARFHPVGQVPGAATHRGGGRPPVGDLPSGRNPAGAPGRSVRRFRQRGTDLAGQAQHRRDRTGPPGGGRGDAVRGRTGTPRTGAVQPGLPLDEQRRMSEPHTPEEQAPQDDGDSRTGRGMRQLSAQQFDALESVGGVRGLIETVLPGLVFVVLYVITEDLMVTVITSVAVAVVAAVARLISRSPITQAVSGLLGVGIGAIWAWPTGDAEDYSAWGLSVNVAGALGVIGSIVIRWPVVGVIVSLLFGRGFSWRSDDLVRRRYSRASWLWAGAFVLRLLVQGPLYFDAQVGWLGTARLVMGLPMWALVLWITWLLVRPRAVPEAPAEPAPPQR